MMIQLIYVSTAAGPVTTAVTGTILRSAQAYNAAKGITGVLCQGQGVYLQVLEGERSAVEALYERIQTDKRHTHIREPPIPWPWPHPFLGVPDSLHWRVEFTE